MQFDKLKISRIKGQISPFILLKIQRGEKILCNLTNCFPDTDMLESFQVITAYTNSKELRKQMEQMQRESKEKGKKDMCKAIRDLMEDSREKGREAGLAEGIRRGREEGMADGRMIMLRCFFSNGGSEEDAVRMLTATKEEIEVARVG